MRMPENVELRCSTLVFRGGEVLLVHRTGCGLDDWVLPGGSPEAGESMVACARRELREETGLAARPARVAFVLEATDPEHRRRVVDLVFAVDEEVRGQVPRTPEPGMDPRFVPLPWVRELSLRPPIAGYLPAFLSRRLERYAPYLGNLWRPDGAGPEGAGAQGADAGRAEGMPAAEE